MESTFRRLDMARRQAQVNLAEQLRPYHLKDGDIVVTGKEMYIVQAHEDYESGFCKESLELTSVKDNTCFDAQDLEEKLLHVRRHQETSSLLMDILPGTACAEGVVSFAKACEVAGLDVDDLCESGKLAENLTIQINAVFAKYKKQIEKLAAEAGVGWDDDSDDDEEE
jgi:hypothetical protein